MLDLIFRLIDRCIQLAEKRREQNRSIHQDFIKPILADFEAVHTDYITSFSEYRDLIFTSECPFDTDHPVITKLARDMLLRQQLRACLFAKKKLMSEDPVIDELLNSIYGYLEGTEEDFIDFANTVPPNAVRLNVKMSLVSLAENSNDKSDEEKRQCALDTIDQAVQELQDSYLGVLETSADLERKLLVPR